MTGYLNAAVGFQHFSNDPVTEVALDGSYGGPMGSWLPNVVTGVPPSPGEDFYQAFVPMVELDFIKKINNRARLRADVQFGQANSGSGFQGINLEHAYAAVLLSEKYEVELVLGRFSMPSGFEPYDNYDNDTISWSILWRSTLPPAVSTGAQLSANFTDNFTLYLFAVNGFIVDSIAKDTTLPCFGATFEIKWGDEAKKSSVVITPFIGPESRGNRPLSFGGDVTVTWWLNEKWQLGLEGILQRDNNAGGGTNTTTFGGLFNLHWEPAPVWYFVIKYCYANQMAGGNGILSLTGAKQQIHEMSLGLGYYIADSVKLKIEGRGDLIFPAVSASQWIAGAALGLFWAF